MYIGLRVKYCSCQNFTKFEFYRHFRKMGRHKVSWKSSSGSPVAPCGQPDTETDMSMPVATFRNFANAPIKHSNLINQSGDSVVNIGYTTGEILALVPGRAIFSKTSIPSLGPTHPPIQFVPSVLSTTIEPSELEATYSPQFPFLLYAFMARGHIYFYLCLIASRINGWSLCWWLCAENVRLFSFILTWWKFNWNVQHAVYAGVCQTLTRIFFEAQKTLPKIHIHLNGNSKNIYRNGGHASTVWLKSIWC
jgi:hypothetical protein